MTKAAKKSNSDYQELLAKLKDIRTLPVVAMRVNELIHDPNSSSVDISEVMKKDQVLTAKILQLVNSSYYAIPGGVSDVQRALAFLGFNTIAQLILSLSVFSIFTSGDTEEFTMMGFWKHALGTAVCSELLAKRLKYPKPEEAFTCGLLHDIGKLVLHEIDPERLNFIVKEAAASKRSFHDVEKEMDLPTHSYLGEVITAKWGLPQVIRLAVRYHHFDVSKMSSILPSAKPVIHIVRLANTLSVKTALGNSGDYSGGEITDDMLKPLNITQTQIPDLEFQLRQEMEKAGAFLNAYL